MDLLDSFKKTDSPVLEIPITHESRNCLDWTSKKRGIDEISNTVGDNQLEKAEEDSK
jgi:hypothetical protein